MQAVYQIISVFKVMYKYKSTGIPLLHKFLVLKAWRVSDKAFSPALMLDKCSCYTRFYDVHYHYFKYYRECKTRIKML